MPPQQHILIIGGGLAGLALSQALRAQSISSTVFERDGSASGRKQSWAVALEGCLPSLKSLLPSDLGPIEAVSNNRKMGVPDGACMMNAAAGTPFLKIGGGEKFGDPAFLLHANRANMRDWLAPGVDLRWSMKFESYVEDGEGVTAYFADGSSARGTALVGVDGAGSPVRSQLLAGLAPELRPLPYGVIAAEYELSPSDTAALREDSSAFQISVKDGVLVFIGLREPATEESAIYYYHLYWVDHSAAAVDTQPYWTQSATQAELRDKVSQLTAGWKGSGKAMIDKSQVEHMMTPPFMLREFSPPDSLPRGKVTLVGDSAHTMTPFRGVGANTALQDAMDLAKLLGESQERDVADVFKEYEAIMIPRGKEMVEVSGKALQADPTGEKVLDFVKEKYGAFQK